jgi:pimeloyl-ACP methyl ester carboxylesterase
LRGAEGNAAIQKPRLDCSASLAMTKFKFQGDDRPPPGWRRLHEAAWLVPRMWRALASLKPLGPRDGPPALVIPGWAASDRVTAALRGELARAGWRVHGWELGFNRGARHDTIERLQRRIEAIGGDRPVLVVGWSLGGVYARELARAAPERVRAVITLGSPFSGDPHQNNVWRLYEWIAGHPVDRPPIAYSATKPPVPTLAIWSRRDGIVAQRSARGLDHERDKAVELRCSHMAFGVSARAGQQVAREIDKFLDETGA